MNVRKRPLRSSESAGWRPAACTRIRTWPAAGAGGSASTRRRTSGPPYSVNTIAELMLWAFHEE
ncbi:hypothetical protein ACFQ9X_18385 [Catenulispora yoronensis]